MILKYAAPNDLATSQVFDHTFSIKCVTTLLLQCNMMLKLIEVLKESSPMAHCYFELLHRDHYCISGIFLGNRLSRGKVMFLKIKR